MTKPDNLCARCAQPGEYCMGQCTVINVRPCKVLGRGCCSVGLYTHIHTRPITFNKPQSLRYSRATSEQPLWGQLGLGTLNQQGSRVMLCWSWGQCMLGLDQVTEARRNSSCICCVLSDIAGWDKSILKEQFLILQLHQGADFFQCSHQFLDSGGRCQPQ